MSYNDLVGVVQEKFASSEKVTCVLSDANVIYPEWVKKERILVIVENGLEKSVFALFSSIIPPKSFSDLSIELVLPIDKDFKCEIDNKQKNVDTLVHLTLISRKHKIIYELKIGPTVGDFVDQLFRGLETVNRLPTSQAFVWLQKYSGNKKVNEQAESPDIVLPRQAIAQGATPVAVRESLIKYEMLTKEDDFTYSRVFKIFVATWNVNDRHAVISLNNWLSVDEDPPDIYAIGFQELDLSKEAFLFDQTSREDEWYIAVLEGVDSRAKYIKVELVRLVGMMLIVLIQEKHLPFVKNIVSDTVGTGIMGKMGNKGGVSIRFDLHNTSLCFVNSHLAAHVEEFERRNQDFHDICSRTNFHQANQPPKSIKDHDQIYWLGDLNYRITELDHAVVKRFLDENNLQAILDWDQLKRQHASHNVFSGYKEGQITFRPTYKYDPGTDNWDSSEKNRAPAWCDRIFWKGDHVKQIAYRSHPTLNISDHKPVSASFNTEIKIIDEEKHRKIYEEVIKKLDKLENELIPQVMVDRTEVDFNIVRYLEPQIRHMTIANTGQVVVQFEFIKKLEESSFCKEWLNVEPYTKCLHPGEKCDVQLEIFVNKKSACKMNSGEDQLYDILVLHLDGGKDIFITVTGTYERSCFGSSIEALVHMRLPIREIPAGKLMEFENKRDQHTLSQNSYSIPKEIWLLVDHIYLHGLKQANLFEQPGLHVEILQIRNWLDSGSTSPIPGSIHSIAEALLLLLESTADPIIPYNLHSVCLSASSNYLQCKQIVMQLPEYRKNVFLYLCEFLQEVLLHSSENGLDAKTLSTLFGTIFLRDTPNVQSENRNRATKQIIDRKKANFVYHFLNNDQSDFILGR